MRIKHRDLTHYFLREHSQLPRAYVASCEKFFKSIGNPRYYGGGPDTKDQAPSVKLQASSSKQQAASGKQQAASLNSNTIK